MYNSVMNIEELMKEYTLEANDIRWYLSNRLSFKMLEFSNDQESLTKFIESGSLEVELYNMEEKYLLELQDLEDRGKLDEVNIREIFNEVNILKQKRK